MHVNSNILPGMGGGSLGLVPPRDHTIVTDPTDGSEGQTEGSSDLKR